MSMRTYVVIFSSEENNCRIASKDSHEDSDIYFVETDIPPIIDKRTAKKLPKLSTLLRIKDLTMNERNIRVKITNKGSEFFGQEGRVVKNLGYGFFDVFLDNDYECLPFKENEFTWLSAEY